MRKSNCIFAQSNHACSNVNKPQEQAATCLRFACFKLPCPRQRLSFLCVWRLELFISGCCFLLITVQHYCETLNYS